MSRVRRQHFHQWKNGNQTPRASEVKITRADGSVEYQPAEKPYSEGAPPRTGGRVRKAGGRRQKRR